MERCKSFDDNMKFNFSQRKQNKSINSSIIR